MTVLLPAPAETVAAADLGVAVERHYANRDYGDARRVMQRITLRGDVPFGPTP